VTCEAIELEQRPRNELRLDARIQPVRPGIWIARQPAMAKKTTGRFKESDDMGESLTQDRRKKAKTKVKSGQGDRGDQ
jgi:hypothetical protein